MRLAWKVIPATVRMIVFLDCALVVVCAVVMWVRGMSVGDRVVWFRRDNSYSGVGVNIWSARGGVGIYVTRVESWVAPEDFGPVWMDDGMVVYPYVPNPQLHKGLVQLAGFAWLGEDIEGRRERTVIFPWAAVIVVFGAPMGWIVMGWTRRRRRRKRLAAGLCVRCGYDLRHSPSLCPECGAKLELIQPAATRG